MVTPITQRVTEEPDLDLDVLHEAWLPGCATGPGSAMAGACRCSAGASAASRALERHLSNGPPLHLLLRLQPLLCQKSLTSWQSDSMTLRKQVGEDQGPKQGGLT